MKRKAKSKSIFRYLPLVLLVVAVIITAIVFVVLDIQKGWNGTKTIFYSFYVIMILCWLALYFPMYSFMVSNNSSMIKSNNELFATLEAIEKAGKLESYKQIKVNKAREKQLLKINNFLLSKNANATPLTYDSLKVFMEEKAYARKPFNLVFDDRVELLVLYDNYSSVYSKDYEKMYSDYKTKRMIRRDSFPLFSTVLPFILSAVGLFGLIYQDVNSTESQGNVLIMYIVLMVEVVLYGILASLSTARKIIPGIIDENNKEIEILKSLL